MLAVVAFFTGTAAALGLGRLSTGSRQRSALQPHFNRSQAVSSTGDASFPVYGFDARNYGAVGDGKTDNTAALQATVDAAIAAGGGTIFLATGAYLVQGTVWVNSSLPLQVRGEGWSSNLLWAGAGDLMVWAPPGGDQPAHLVLQDFAVSCVGSPKVNVTGAGDSATALRFSTGIVRSVLSTLLFYGAGNVPGTGQQTVLCGNNLDLGPTTDTVTMRDVLHWFVGSTGVYIGKGSEVRISGGRIIGQLERSDGSVGVHISGNNGGVHITDTDIIGLDVGVWINDAVGAGSNREIFITHATMDSNGIGLHIQDNSYTSISGCWTASSDKHQILLDTTATGAHLQVVGGTIFNGGVISGDCSEVGQECNGITAFAGRFSVTGTLIWANKRVGVWAASPGLVGYMLTGNRLECNGQAVRLNGTSYAATGNVVLGSKVAPDWGTLNGGAVVANNVNASGAFCQV